MRTACRLLLVSVALLVAVGTRPASASALTDVTKIEVTTSADSQPLAATAGARFVGVVASEEAAGAAKFFIRCGTSTSGWVIAPVVLASGGADTFFPPISIPCADGLFFDKVSGTTIVTLYYRTTP